MGRVRIGFVGAGGMGQCAHLRNYVTVPDCEVVALAEIRPKLRQAIAGRYGIAKVYANAREMIEAEKLDGIVASQPFNRHGVIVPEILGAGVPVFTEKPLAASVEVGERIVDAVAKSGTWHMVGYHKRSDPASMFARVEIERLKASSELGGLKYVRILMPAGIGHGRGNLPRLHGLRELLHSPGEPAALLPGRKLQGHVCRADPSGVMLAAVSESGVAGVIEMSPYQTTVDWQESALIAFERGWIRVDLPAPLASNLPGTVTMYRDPGDTPPVAITPQLPWIHAMRQQAINFVAAIRGQARLPCEAAEALEDLRAAREYIRLLKGS